MSKCPKCKSDIKNLTYLSNVEVSQVFSLDGGNMTNCTCGHSKKEHNRTVSGGISPNKYAVGLGCAKCECDSYGVKCGEYFRPNPNPERLEGTCAKRKGHEGRHNAMLMYQILAHKPTKAEAVKEMLLEE